jgi:hypothetical protein
MDQVDDLIFTASPTCARFMKFDCYGRIIAGPIGSGKTIACLMELLRRSVMQAPASDGYSYTRWAICRQTLKQLKDTVLKDVDTWIGARGLGMWKVSESTYHIQFDNVRSEWIFLPLDNAEDQARLLSMQLTGAWMSECIEMDLNVLGPISGRLGRYPSGARGTPSWYGMIADTNMPTEMTPWHHFFENLPSDWAKFIQPSGMAHDAENLDWLVQTPASIALPLGHPVRRAQGRRYYERLVEMYGRDSDWVKRYVYAQYGDDPSGLAVFKNTFNPRFHLVDQTQIIPGYPLLIGQDFGRNPWSIICQPDHMGRLVVHEEVPGINVGLEKHLQQNLRPRLMQDRYLGLKNLIVGDPAGGAKDSISEESCIDACKRMGFPAFPAPTNDIEPRLRAVEALLGRQTNGGPTLVINAQACPFLARGMAGGYRFAKSKEGTLKPKPDKENGADFQGVRVAFSHVCDTLQYVSLVVHGGIMPYFMSYLQPRRPTGPKVSTLGWT